MNHLKDGPPNPRPKPKERPVWEGLQETKYMNSRLRDDSNFWVGFYLGAFAVCLAIAVGAILSLFV